MTVTHRGPPPRRLPIRRTCLVLAAVFAGPAALMLLGGTVRLAALIFGVEMTATDRGFAMFMCSLLALIAWGAVASVAADHWKETP